MEQRAGLTLLENSGKIDLFDLFPENMTTMLQKIAQNTFDSSEKKIGYHSVKGYRQKVILVYLVMV